MPQLTRITVFPIKSFDGLELTQAEILAGGALRHDRRWALVDSEENFISGKRCPAIHQIRATYDEDCRQVTLRAAHREATFSLSDEPSAIGEWCGEVLGQACRLVENAAGGFPDDCDASGPTLIGTATLAAVASWFDALSLEETRRRFRANLEIDADVPFWEDRLVGPLGKMRRFCIADTIWQGQGVCQRCAVPTRNSRSGEVTPGFAHRFSLRREATSPNWSPLERFDHFYRLAINTQLESISGEPFLKAGNLVEVVEDASLADNQ